MCVSHRYLFSLVSLPPERLSSLPHEHSSRAGHINIRSFTYTYRRIGKHVNACSTAGMVWELDLQCSALNSLSGHAFLKAEVQ